MNKLVYFERFETEKEAKFKAKQMKKWNRAWKTELIEKQNPEWLDLYKKIV